MKNDRELMQNIRSAIDDCTRGIDEAPSLQYQIARKARGEEPVVKKVTTTFVVVLALMAITITALAAGIIYNQDWYYNNHGRALKEHQPEVYEAVMANLTENPEQTQSNSDLINVTIQDVSWAPEAQKLTISFRVSVKDPSHYELHGMWALDTDGAYVGEGGSNTVTDDGEDRAMHWLWRSFDTDNYSEPGRYGPPMEMMDDSARRLLLIDRKGISLFDGALEAFGSMDMLRTPEGDILFIEEIDLDWLSEDFDQKMKEYGEQYPEMQDYANERIAAAQAARAKLKDGTIPCRLTYTVVEYTEGMDDKELYSGGEHGSIDFIIRPRGTT